MLKKTSSQPRILSIWRQYSIYLNLSWFSLLELRRIAEIMKKAFLYLLIVIAGHSYGQQDAIYSQYMFNPFAIKPAYAGSRNSYSAVLLHRSQWVGMPWAPSTQSFAVHAPAAKSGIAWGINFAHDQIGPSRNIVAAATGAYIIKFDKSKLAFGLRAGIYNTVLDRSKLNFKENAIKEVASKAIKKKTGARGLRSILENVLLKTMFEIPSMENVSEVIVDVSSVKGETQPIIVHSKNKQDKDKSKTTAA